MAANSPETHPRVARNRAAVLLAGRQILLERGVRGITVEAIAGRTGIAKTTIYRHWPSKAELVMAVIADQAFTFPSPGTGDALNDLKVSLKSFSETLADPAHRITLLGILELSARDPSVDGAHRSFLAILAGALREAIQRAVASGQIAAGPDTNFTVELLIGPIFFRALLLGTPFTGAEIDSLLARILGRVAG